MTGSPALHDPFTARWLSIYTSFMPASCMAENPVIPTHQQYTA
jgi:hypothetical protein